MTTIAANRDRMCADSNCTVGDIEFPTPKLFVVRGAIIGTAGSFAPGERFMKWYGSGRPLPKLLQDKGEDFEALVLTHEGLVYYDSRWTPIPVADGRMAIGTGEQGALTSLRYWGATPEQAVEAACMADKNSVLPVQTTLLSSVRPPRKRKV